MKEQTIGCLTGIIILLLGIISFASWLLLPVGMYIGWFMTYAKFGLAFSLLWCCIGGFIGYAISKCIRIITRVIAKIWYNKYGD